MRTERIFVNTFSNCDSEPRTVDVAPLKFIANDKPNIIEALFAPDICSGVFGQNIEKRNYAHLKNIKLANPFDARRKKINILIGLDPYFKYKTGNIRRDNENEPIALDSCFGRLISSYYESSFSTTVNSFTNIRLNTYF